MCVNHKSLEWAIKEFRSLKATLLVDISQITNIHKLRLQEEGGR